LDVTFLKMLHCVIEKMFSHGIGLEYQKIIFEKWHKKVQVYALKTCKIWTFIIIYTKSWQNYKQNYKSNKHVVNLLNIMLFNPNVVWLKNNLENIFVKRSPVAICQILIKRIWQIVILHTYYVLITICFQDARIVKASLVIR